MRDTKFRGLTTKGEMIFGSLVVADAHIKHMPKQHTKTWIVTSAFGNGGWFNIRQRQYVKPETVGQFIGLQDKNGVDIYEGDVLSIRGWLGEVYYKNVNGRFDVKELNEGPHGALAHKFSHGEIIGNIHSNPE